MAIEAFWAGLPVVWKGVIVAGVFFLVSEAVRIFGPKEEEESEPLLDLNAVLQAGDNYALQVRAVAVEEGRLDLQKSKLESSFWLIFWAMFWGAVIFIWKAP